MHSHQLFGESCGEGLVAAKTQTTKDTKEHKKKVSQTAAGELPVARHKIFCHQSLSSCSFVSFVAKELLDQFVQHLLRLLMQVRRSAVHHTRGFAGAVKHEHGWDGRDVTEGLRRGGISDGPVQAGAQRIYGFAHLVFGRFNSKRQDG